MHHGPNQFPLLIKTSHRYAPLLRPHLGSWLLPRRPIRRVHWGVLMHVAEQGSSHPQEHHAKSQWFLRWASYHYFWVIYGYPRPTFPYCLPVNTVIVSSWKNPHMQSSDFQIQRDCSRRFAIARLRVTGYLRALRCPFAWVFRQVA